MLYIADFVLGSLSCVPLSSDQLKDAISEHADVTNPGWT